MSKIIINNNNKMLMMSERHVSVLLSVSECHNHAAEGSQVRVEEPQQEAHLVDTYYRFCRYCRYYRYCRYLLTPVTRNTTQVTVTHGEDFSPSSRNLSCSVQQYLGSNIIYSPSR